MAQTGLNRGHKRLEQKKKNACKSMTCKRFYILAEWTGPTVKTTVFPLCGSGWQHKNTKKTDTKNATTMGDPDGPGQHRSAATRPR